MLGSGLAQRWHGAWSRRGSELRVAVRVTFAGTATFVLARSLGLAQGYWAVITSVIVVQTSLGGSLKAAVERTLGTLAGAIFGGCVGLVVPHGATSGLGAAVAVALAPLAFFAAIDPRFRVAPVTALIVLMTATPQATGALYAAVDRILEIALGNLVGVAVSMIVLPARAHRAALFIGAEVIEAQAKLIDRLLQDHEGVGPEIVRLQSAIRSGLKRLETAVEEANRERQMPLSSHADLDPLQRTLHRVRHDLVMVARATAEPGAEPLRGRLEPGLQAFRTRVGASMDAIAAAMRDRVVAPSVAEVARALADYGSAIEDARAEGLTRDLSGEAVGRVFALRFALEQLVQDLHDLVARIGELAEPPG